MKRSFLTAEWRDLIMATYVIDPAVLLPFLPARTSLDLYNGDAYVSLVGFMFTNTRILGFKIPMHVDFEEVNLRFYVRYFENGTWKRGTVFIKEIVPKWAVGFVANTLYNEKYSTMPMKHFLHENAAETWLGYHWKYRNRWNKLEATFSGTALPMVAGSGEEFIAEHYWGYSKYAENITFEYEVIHPPWKVFPVKEYTIDCDFTALYGPAFEILQDTLPASVFVADGSAIQIQHKKNL